MPVFQLEQKNVVFVHIPKTGGSSIDDWLFDFAGCTRMLFSPQPLPDMTATPQHICYQTIVGLLGPQIAIDYSFAVVRNPFKRLESEYKYRLDLGLLAGHANPESLFPEWVAYALDKARSTPHMLDNHLRPQSYFVAPEVDIFKFEDGLNEASQAISQRLGLTGQLLPAVPNTKISKKRHLQWNANSIERVQQFYATDFTQFGYSAEPTGLDIRAGKQLTSLARRLYHFDRKHKKTA